MAESERGTESTDAERTDGNGAEEPDPKPPFAKGWRWPLIILVVGIVAMTVFVTLLTQPEELPAPPPPPPPPPPPGFVAPRA